MKVTRIPFPKCCLFLWAFSFAACTPLTGAEQESLSEQHIEYFEKKIRPVLVTHCYECHSADAAKKNKLKGGLYVDTRQALLTGGESGPAVVAKQPDESLLLEALRYESFEMPPKGKLPDQVIADFQKWIELGAPDPRTGNVAATTAELDIQAGRKHWSYQPIKKTSIPEVSGAVTLIDAFILARLQRHNLKQIPAADKTTLVRRLYFDLSGLPPTPEDVDQFLNDASPDAYVQLVDRLLSSPRFGERWGRHWLDVVRFAESITLRGFVLPEAWRYRDYVVDAFNADRPFDRMVREQVAGDLLPSKSLQETRRNLIATTFLTLGNNNLEDQDKQKLRMDVVDEQLETIGRGFLAQTIGCARCHDHKFDPIPTRDYYALAGILRNTKTLNHANVSMWLELPLPIDPEKAEIVNRHEAAVKDLNSKIKKLKSLVSGSLAPLDPKTLPGTVVDDAAATLQGEWKKSSSVKGYVGAGYQHDQAGPERRTATFQPAIAQAAEYEIRFAYTPGTNRSAAVPITIVSQDGEKTVYVNQKKKPPIDGTFVSLGLHRLGPNRGRVVVSNENADGHVIIDAVQFLPKDLIGKPKPAVVSSQEKDRHLQELKALEKELKQLTQSGPVRSKSMSIQEEPDITDTHVHIRGDVHNLGDPVARGFLQVATYGDSAPFNQEQSGRLQLGQWLGSQDNPLTARVAANRCWHWLFGVGLVRTTDNFGTTGEAPSHPQLLDYLATRLIDQNWSLKSLVREIVLSKTYRLASSTHAASTDVQQAKDPANRWLWKMNRRRLDAESLQDALLAVSGQLDLAIGGKTIRDGVTVDYDFRHGSFRRAVYWPVFRNSLPRLFEVFDFANPSMVVGRRNVSSTPPQALFLMNNRLVIQYAQQAARELIRMEDDITRRVDRAFRLSLGRRPTDTETKTVADFVQKAETDSRSDQQQIWTQIVHSLFASIDFRFLQ